MASTYRLWTTKDVTTCTELMPTFNNSRQNCQHRKMKTVEQRFIEERLNGPVLVWPIRDCVKKVVT